MKGETGQGGKGARHLVWATGRRASRPTCKGTRRRSRGGGFRRPPPVARSDAGFTLLELVVVVALLAVVGAMAVPAFRPPPREAALEEGAGRVEALFRMARMEAVRQGAPVTVVLDSTSSRVWIDTRNVTEGEDLELPPGVRLEVGSARATWHFRPGGSASGDSVVVRGPSGGIRIVTVDPWTGHASVR